MENTKNQPLTPKQLITQEPFDLVVDTLGAAPRSGPLFLTFNGLACELAAHPGSSYYVAVPGSTVNKGSIAAQQVDARAQLLKHKAQRNALSLIVQTLKPEPSVSSRKITDRLRNDISLVVKAKLPDKREQDRFESLFHESLEFVARVRAEAKLQAKVPAYVNFRQADRWYQEEYLAGSVLPLLGHGIMDRIAQNLIGVYMGASGTRMTVHLSGTAEEAGFFNVLREVIKQSFVVKRLPAPDVVLLELVLSTAKKNGSLVVTVNKPEGHLSVLEACCRLYNGRRWYRALLSDALPKLVSEPERPRTALPSPAQRSDEPSATPVVHVKAKSSKAPSVARAL